MALIIYLTKAPRYKNTTVKEIKLIESYFRWKHEKEIGSKYATDTFEKWCGHSETELPNSDVVDYYKTFLIKDNENYDLFERLGRFVKANQIFNWFIKNVMNGEVNQEYYTITKEQLENLLCVCRKVRSGFTFLKKNKYNEDEYVVDESVAKDLLPLMEKKGHFFGTNEYNNLYASQVIDVINILDNILKTTNFDKETVYFNAIW